MVEADITLCTKHYSQAGWVAFRKQFRLIHSVLFDGSSLVTQDVIVF